MKRVFSILASVFYLSAFTQSVEWICPGNQYGVDIEQLPTGYLYLAGTNHNDLERRIDICLASTDLNLNPNQYLQSFYNPSYSIIPNDLAIGNIGFFDIPIAENYGITGTSFNPASDIIAFQGIMFILQTINQPAFISWSKITRVNTTGATKVCKANNGDFIFMYNFSDEDNRYKISVLCVTPTGRIRWENKYSFLNAQGNLYDATEGLVIHSLSNSTIIIGGLGRENQNSQNSSILMALKRSNGRLDWSLELSKLSNQSSSAINAITAGPEGSNSFYAIGNERVSSDDKIHVSQIKTNGTPIYHTLMDFNLINGHQLYARDAALSADQDVLGIAVMSSSFGVNYASFLRFRPSTKSFISFNHNFPSSGISYNLETLQFRFLNKSFVGLTTVNDIPGTSATNNLKVDLLNNRGTNEPCWDGSGVSEPSQYDLPNAVTKNVQREPVDHLLPIEIIYTYSLHDVNTCAVIGDAMLKSVPENIATNQEMVKNALRNSESASQLESHSIYDIYDLNGKYLETQKFEYRTEEVNLNHLPNGIYLIKNKNSKSAIMKKMVKW